MTELANQDQYKINQELAKQIKAIETSFQAAGSVYEDLLKLKDVSKDTGKLDEAFATILFDLSKRNYATASVEIAALKTTIAGDQAKIAAAFIIPANVPVKNIAPGSGFSQQSVQSDVGTFLVDIIAGDLGSTRVIVDTASDHDCFNDCPVLSLADYVGRSGAYAGVNGSYFCPSTYPSCADKKNTFDTLLMNKNKVYFDSANNAYSTVPAVIFGGGWVRFVGRSLEWGRDTGIDSMIANRPMLLSGGNIAVGDVEAKEANRGGRSFVGNKGNTVYIGVVFNATVSEAAHALKTLGLENAINLDDGGSTALWSGGYRAGPGRNIPMRFYLSESKRRKSPVVDRGKREVKE